LWVTLAFGARRGKPIGVTRPTLDVPLGYLGLALRTPTLPPAAHTNCYVVGHQDALVVDPGSPYAAEQELLAQRLYRLLGSGGSLRGVLLTHHHGDHVGGAAAVAQTFDLPLLAHRLTFARLDDVGGRWRRDELAALPREILDEGAGATLVVDGERELQLLHTPGHAVGHICLLERSPGPAAGTLLGGDMAPGLGTTLIDPDEGSMAEYLQQLRRLAALEPARILPAHGPQLAPGREALEALVAHREQRERRVLGALTSESRLAEVVAREAYAELRPPFLALALRSTLAHLEKLESEGHVRRSQAGWALAS
jgi:ribonuclease/clavin/mitogillin